jgi:FMN reductase
MQRDSVRLLVIVTSRAPRSRSTILAGLCVEELLALGAEATIIRLEDYPLGPFTGEPAIESEAYRNLHREVSAADGLVLTSPVYNWGCSAELKNFVEHIGSTSSEHRGAFFDKTITFVNAGGVPQSYTAFAGTAIQLMLDFKCVINPYHLYVHNGDWEGGAESEQLGPRSVQRLRKTMRVMVELTGLLRERSYTSNWEI